MKTTGNIVRLQQISDIKSLCDFSANLSILNPEDQALKIKLDKYIAHKLSIDDHSFDSKRFVSEDLSCVMYGSSPVIFMGSNDWAIKRLLDLENLNNKTDGFKYIIESIAGRVKGRLCFIIAPEKDFVMDRIAGRSHATSNMTRSLEKLKKCCDDLGLGFIHDRFIDELPHWISEDEYNYADTHLLGRDYLCIFYEALEKIGLSRSLIQDKVVLRSRQIVGDLNDKFGAPLVDKEHYLVPHISAHGAKLRGGSSYFEKPLGKTTQYFENPYAPVKAKVEIYGDSHSSIIDQRRLTYLFAAVFERCDFRWMPWGGGKPEEFTSDADFIIMEISQRFVFT